MHLLENEDVQDSYDAARLGPIPGEIDVSEE